MLGTLERPVVENTLSARIKTLMSKAKLTQTALAAELGVAQSSIAYYLSPKTTNARMSYAVGQALEAAERKYRRELAA